MPAPRRPAYAQAPERIESGRAGATYQEALSLSVSPMSLSMYDASIASFLRALDNLGAILNKAVANAEARKFDPAVLLGARLAPDMAPFSAQIQRASDTAKGFAARVAGVTQPSFPDTETSFPALRQRIAATVDFLKSIERARIDGSEARVIEIKMGKREVTFTGQTYLLNFALPNFFFHVTTAYAILRHNGVDVGKMDFLGGL
jgi:hypothetical protein